MEKIKIKKALELKDAIFVDTRSPGEFALDKIQGAINIPIFDNEERVEIGKLYKKDKDKAFDLGLDYYSKKLPNLVKYFRKLDKNKKIVVYCWRGGVRSKAITQVMDLLSYKAVQLDGGYKSYREFIRGYFEDFSAKFKFIVLWGNTGTAKTKIIHKLDTKIDLEDLAQHRSSLFGAVGFEPRTQKCFETLLFIELKRLEDSDERFVFVEGESRKIGNIIIPEKVYRHIKQGINIQVKAGLRSRVQITVDEYLKPEYIESIRKIVPALKLKLSKKIIAELLALLDEKNHSKFAEILLTQYYDPLYRHTLESMDYKYSVNSDDIDACVQELKKIRTELIVTVQK